MSSNLPSRARRRLLAGAICLTFFAGPVAPAAAQNAASAEQVEHHTAEFDGTRCHYVTAGTGNPALPPGLPGEAANLKTSQVSFNRSNDLPRMLVQGHAKEFLAWIHATKAPRGETADDACTEWAGAPATLHPVERQS
jgi:hypothetical protein